MVYIRDEISYNFYSLVEDFHWIDIIKYTRSNVWINA